MRPLARRRTWRTSRRSRGLKRPRPLYVVAGNCMSVSTGAEHAAAIFRAYLDCGADVLLLTECADFDAATVAADHAPGVWGAHQPGAVGSPASGALVAWRRIRAAPVNLDLRLGSHRTPEGGDGGIRDRFIVGALLVIDAGTEHEWRRWFRAGHAPPQRAPKARAVFMYRFARAGGIRGGDLNLLPRAVARFVTGARVRGVRVLCLVTPWWVPAGRVRRIPKATLAGADHDGVGLTLWPKR